MRMTRFVRRAVAMIAAAVLGVPLALAASFAEAQPAAAASSFDPGHIISDSQFYDAHAMTAAQIQSFLDAKIGTCLNGKCLNVATIPFAAREVRYTDGDFLVCNAIPGGNVRASELIYRVQVACGISAKVILVTMQKEQGIVTSKQPTDYALKYAMGYACPDSSGCSNANAGLGVQIYQGARQLKTYKAPAGGWKYQPHASQFIAYHPDYLRNGCGGTNVAIRNYATAALYNYTPYQPNAAALANLYNVGDSCSSYGNRNFWAYYRDWFGDPTQLTPVGVTVDRIGAADRYMTAAAVSAAYFPSGARVAYVASGDDFADAISAAPAAAHESGPVLLVERGRVPASVLAELKRLAPERIVIVGGTGAVAAGVEKSLAKVAAQVDRVSGVNRFETSRAVMTYAFGAAVPEVYLAAGNTFADALSASAAAGSRGAPIVLIEGVAPKLDAATTALLTDAGTDKVYIAGGPGVVTASIEKSLTKQLGADAVTRFSGSDRYGTANAVNLERFPSADMFFVASGEDFADALGAAPVAAMNSVPLYVTPKACMPRSLVQHIIDAGASDVMIVGGTGAVSSAAAKFRNC